MKVVVVGATDITTSLIREIVDKGHQVAVFDDVKENVEKLKAELDITGAAVDLLNFDELEEYGFSRADVVVLAHRDDTVNAVLSMYAKIVNIPRVLVVSRSKKVADAVRKLGLASAVLAIESLIEKAMASAFAGVETIELPGGYVVAALDSRTMSRLVGMSIADFRDRWRFAVLKVVDREGAVREPVDDYVIKEGDVVLVLAEKPGIRELLP